MEEQCTHIVNLNLNNHVSYKVVIIDVVRNSRYRLMVVIDLWKTIYNLYKLLFIGMNNI